MDQRVMELLANIYQSQTEMRSELNQLRSKMQSELKDFRSEMQSELKDFRSEMQSESKEFRSEMQSESNGLKMDQETIARNVAKIITIIEHDLAQKIGAIFDFREIQIDHNRKTGQALESIEAKVEVLQLETSNLRRIK